MKALLLTTLFVVSLTAGAEVPMAPSVDRSMKRPAQAAAELVKLHGYRCDKIDFFARSTWDGAFHLTCNGNRYSYVIKDEGGRWTVRVR